MELSVAFFIFTVNVISASIIQDNEKEIQNLETKKNEIIELINEGIDDVLNHLGLSNDTNATEVMNYMKELRNRIKEANETYDMNVLNKVLGKTSFDEVKHANNDVEDSINNKNIHNLNGTAVQFDQTEWKIDNDTRRLRETIETSFNNKKTFSKQLNKKKMSKKYQQRREEMEKRIGAWMEERMKEKEKKKKREKRLKENNYEFCPDFGLKKGKKKYPCCRKCCKTSYLGCL